MHLMFIHLRLHAAIHCLHLQIADLRRKCFDFRPLSSARVR